MTTKLLEENRRNDKKIIQEKLQNQLENEINEMNQIDPSDDKSKKKAEDVLLELLKIVISLTLYKRMAMMILY